MYESRALIVVNEAGDSNQFAQFIYVHSVVGTEEKLHGHGCAVHVDGYSYVVQHGPQPSIQFSVHRLSKVLG